MNDSKSEIQKRLLPTYRWDLWDTRTGKKVTDGENELRDNTQKLISEFIRGISDRGETPLPPVGVVNPIINMNIAKRSQATRAAEDMIERGEIAPPPQSLIPTFMAYGSSIVGVEDRYMQDDHPSQEIFAYNRIGKRSWFNRRFGKHCLTAIAIAHPHGFVESATQPPRVKAHSSRNLCKDAKHDPELDDWVIVSSKAPIAIIQENGRQASLISRVTGAVDMSSPRLSQEEFSAIRSLSEHEALPDEDSAAILGQKALLLSALERNDDNLESPFYPVIQTVYLTQLTRE